jgi:hypothetical protein
LATARGRAYVEGKIDSKNYSFLYLLKGIGQVPVGGAESVMVALALRYGYQMPLALLEVL